jgi:hypothetical protein
MSTANYSFSEYVYRKVCVSMDISLNIRGYLITYSRIFHYVSVYILHFACLIATFRACRLGLLLAVCYFSHSVYRIGGSLNPERASQHIREGSPKLRIV